MATDFKYKNVQIAVSPLHWMKEVRDIHDPTIPHAYVVGRIMGTQHTIAVSENNTGITRYYCDVHQRIFKFNQTCPDCQTTTDKQ